jgi:hypothetical protein
LISHLLAQILAVEYFCILFAAANACALEINAKDILMKKYIEARMKFFLEI